MAMSDTTTLTIRLPTKLKRRLDKLAKASKRSRSGLAADAVERYLAEQERQSALIEQAELEIDAGHFMPHEEVKRWMLSWGTDHELPPPASK